MSYIQPASNLVSFVIPTLYHIDMLQSCIKSIHETCIGLNYEIIVIDDGSVPAIQNRLQDIKDSLGFKLLRNPKNMGYTASVNLGIKHASGDPIILLNDDIVLKQKNWLTSIFDVLNIDNKIGIVGCRLLYPDGKIQHGGMYYMGGLQLLGHKHWGRPGNIPEASKTLRTVAVTGAIMVIKRAVIEAIGMLNEDFIILCSDTDYCLTAHSNGWMVVYNGRSYAIHHESQTRSMPSIIKGSVGSSSENQDLIKFYRKWSSQIRFMHIRGMI